MLSSYDNKDTFEHSTQGVFSGKENFAQKPFFGQIGLTFGLK